MKNSLICVLQIYTIIKYVSSKDNNMIIQHIEADNSPYATTPQQQPHTSINIE